MDIEKNIHVRGRHFHCSLCDVKITSEKAVQAHVGGKKHNRLLDLKNCRQKQAEKSIFVGGLNKLMSELALTDHFMKFGDVSKVIIDKDKGQFAIVEFTDKEGVLKASEVEKQTLLGQKITVRPREHKPFEVQSRGGKGDKAHPSNRYGTVPSELQKAIVLRLSPAEDVSTQMKELVSLLELPPSALKFRFLICDLLHEVFKEFFPACEVYPFGSSVNGFGMQGADLDLHLDLDATGFEYEFTTLGSGARNEVSSSMKSSFQEESMDATSEDAEETPDGIEIDLETASDKDIMEMVSKVLRQCVPQCQAIRGILHARRPVVKFQHKESKLCCDISMKNRLALRNTELLQFYTTLDERVRPLIYTIRHWGKVRQISGGGGPRLTNYALSLLVVYFLQTRDPSVLPTVDQLRKGNDSSDMDMIEGWDCSFSQPSKNTTNIQSTVELLREFFHFYSTFDFTTNVISLKTGSALPISTFTPPESPVHQDQIFRLGALNIQDPFELSHNVAFNVSEKVVYNFCKEVKKAYTMTLSNKFKKKPASLSATDLVAWGLPVLFDADSYGNAASKRTGSSPSTSTDGSVVGEDLSTYSISIVMKASQLSEAFVKSHGSSNSLRSAWCDATIAFIKQILSEALRIECQEQSIDEGQVVASESSAEQCQSTAQAEGSMSDKKTVADDNILVCDSASVAETVASKDVGYQNGSGGSVETRKHHLDVDDGEENNGPRKRTKLTDDASDDNETKPISDDSSVGDKTLSSDGKEDVKMQTGSDVVKSSEVIKEETIESEMETEQSCEADQLHLVCTTSHQVWLGRRKVRRHLGQSNPALQASPPSDSKTTPSIEERLKAETMVTDHIISEDTAGGEQPLTKFKVSFKKSEETGQCCLGVDFQPVEGLPHLKALFQFLQTFLVKLIDQHQL